MKFQKEFERAFAVHRQGKLREAFLRYDAILKADPKHAQALHLSGVVLHQSGQRDAAVERIRASLAVDATCGEAWSNLAMVFDSSGRKSAAIRALKEAVRHTPGAADIAANLAAMQVERGEFAEAEATARHATRVDPTHPSGWYNLALALHRQDRILEARDAVGRAVALAPHDATFSGLKAQIEQQAGAPDRARATLESALARSPTSPVLRFDYAKLLEDSGKPAAAAEAYAQVVRLDPDHGPALSQLVFLKRWLADWRDLAALEQQFREAVAKRRALLSPFVLLGGPSTLAEQRSCANAWSGALATPPLRMRRPLSQGKLKLGYLSADFHAHPTAFLAAGLFERHDRSRFEVVAYSMGPDDGSPMRKRLARAFDRFLDMGGEPAGRVAARIRDDGIDLLIDLKGHLAGATPRVLALRPAPIQVHYLGFPGTLGAGLADYLIGDAIVTPPADAPAYGEALVRLPGSYQINDRNRAIVEAPPRSALGLPDDAVVFCNFGPSWKLTPEAMDAWARIVKRVPGAVLWVATRNDADPAAANLRREAEARGIERSRLVFAAARPYAETLGLYARADLFLDSWPHNANGTGSDALWAGCPVLTLRGTTFASRIGESLSRAVGLPELVAADVDAYVEQAVALAVDADARARLRRYLAGAGRDSPLFDTERTTRALERAYLAMADQYRRGVREPIDLV